MDFLSPAPDWIGVAYLFGFHVQESFQQFTHIVLMETCYFKMVAMKW